MLRVTRWLSASYRPNHLRLTACEKSTSDKRDGKTASCFRLYFRKFLLHCGSLYNSFFMKFLSAFRIVLFFPLLVYSSCTSHDDEILPSNFESPSYRVSSQELIDALEIEVGTRSDAILIEPILFESDTVLFLVNTKKGWMLFSSDKRTCPILARGTNEHFDKTLLDNNPAIKSWLNSQKSYLQLLRKNPFGDINSFWLHAINQRDTREDDPPGSGWRLIHTGDTTIVYDYIPRIIETAWGQLEPWNECTPYISINYPGVRSATGCVNVAYAQILYWAHNTYGVPAYMYTDASCNDYINDQQQYTFFFNDSSTTAWNQIKLDSAVTSPGSADYASYLMAKVSRYDDTEYGYDDDPVFKRSTGSLLCSDNISWLRGVFSLDAIYTTYDTSSVIANLRSSIPSIIVSNGHAWIIDGYRHAFHSVRRYFIWDPWHTYVIPSGGDISEEDDEPGGEYYTGNGYSFDCPEGYNYYIEEWPNTQHYFTMNWGWSGLGNSIEFAAESIVWPDYSGQTSGFPTSSAIIMTHFIPYNPEN